MKKTILILASVMMLMVGCGANDDATFKRLMLQEGITNSTNLGPAWFGCSGSDSGFYNIKFTGVKNNIPVSGVICGAPMKGYTIRYN